MNVEGQVGSVTAYCEGRYEEAINTSPVTTLASDS